MSTELPQMHANFMSRVEMVPESGCWIWLGAFGKDAGYGYAWDGKRMIGAHRMAYELFKGPIPKGLTIDHLCRVRCCVNPEHLEVVTQRINTLRGIGPTAENHRKETCPFGHEMVRKWGRRNCVVCRRKARLAHDRKSRKELAAVGLNARGKVSIPRLRGQDGRYVSGPPALRDHLTKEGVL